MKDCTCAICVNACEQVPGWLMPGDIDPLAAYLGISPEELLARHLVVEYWDRCDRAPTFVLAPKYADHAPGKVAWSWKFGHCTFLKEGRCSIHAVKPYECRRSMPCEGSKGVHEQVRDAWDSHAMQELLDDFIYRAREWEANHTIEMVGRAQLQED